MDEDRSVRMSLLVLAALLDAMTQARLLIHVHLYPPSATHSKDEWLFLGTVALVPLLSSYSSPWSPLSFPSVLTLACARLHRVWCPPSDHSYIVQAFLFFLHRSCLVSGPPAERILPMAGSAAFWRREAASLQHTWARTSLFFVSSQGTRSLPMLLSLNFSHGRAAVLYGF